MISPELATLRQATLEDEIDVFLTQLGEGHVRGVAYDTAWVARLAPRYNGSQTEAALEWLRHNQYEDGTWGGRLVQYHDRFISTLAAIVALREVRADPRDERRVQRGEQALWKIVGRLGRDDSDTIGFPILSAALANDAASLGLDVPSPPIRYASAYHRKVERLLNSPQRDWRKNTLTFSLEGLRKAVQETDRVLEENGSVSSSPAATAAYSLEAPHAVMATSKYLKSVQQEDGSIPAVTPIDLFEIAWSINHLRLAGAVTPEMPQVRRLLSHLWEQWSPVTGVSYSSHFAVKDLDVTSASFTVLNWGGYDVSSDVFGYYEAEDHFLCYPEETNPALSAHVRLLAALRTCQDERNYRAWVSKIVDVLHRFDDNGSYWWDKWHASPYYVSGVAVNALHGVDDELAYSRLKWILRTQNDDGGWGYLGTSTAEETAYCLEALLYWHANVARIDRDLLDAAAEYLWKNLPGRQHPPLWIGKSLYYPPGPVKAAVLGALYSYTTMLL